MRPKRIRIAPGAKRVLHVRAVPRRRAAPGDHPALVLLTTRPLGVKHVRVRLRVGVIVVLRVRGRIVRRLDARALTVRRSKALRLLELRLVNRGNVAERLAGDGLRLALLSGGRKVATLRPRSRELLPHSAGIAVFVYRGATARSRACTGRAATTRARAAALIPSAPLESQNAAEKLGLGHCPIPARLAVDDDPRHRPDSELL